jgi:hypothetical protein
MMKFIEKWPNCSGHHLWLRHLKILKVKIQDKTNKVIFLPCWQVVQYEMAHEKPKLLILNPLDWGYFKAEHNYSLLWAYKYGFFASMVLPFFFFACEHWHVCIQQIRLHAQVSEWFRGLWTQIWYSNLRYSVNQVLENSNQINHLKKDKIQHLTCKWSRTMRWSSFAVPQMTFNTRFTPCQWRRN